MFAPITFEEDDRGGLRTIASAGAAEQVLSDWWSIPRGPLYLFAARACLAAREGSGSEEAAHEAFRAALIEAGLFVRQ